MVRTIRHKLQLVNGKMLRSDDFSLSKYEPLYDIYTLVQRQKSISTFQIEAILEELKALRDPSSSA
ncbi:DUF1128 family protein [Sporolactobacillus sp. THM7-7]|nr:DUF1128 family protein [Sporolactobacillus sp. THM7-7]